MGVERGCLPCSPIVTQFFYPFCCVIPEPYNMSIMDFTVSVRNIEKTARHKISDRDIHGKPHEDWKGSFVLNDSSVRVKDDIRDDRHIFKHGHKRKYERNFLVMLHSDWLQPPRFVHCRATARWHGQPDVLVTFYHWYFVFCHFSVIKLKM